MAVVLAALRQDLGALRDREASARAQSQQQLEAFLGQAAEIRRRAAQVSTGVPCQTADVRSPATQVVPAKGQDERSERPAFSPRGLWISEPERLAREGSSGPRSSCSRRGVKQTRPAAELVIKAADTFDAEREARLHAMIEHETSLYTGMLQRDSWDIGLTAASSQHRWDRELDAVFELESRITGRWRPRFHRPELMRGPKPGTAKKRRRRRRRERHCCTAPDDLGAASSIGVHSSRRSASPHSRSGNQTASPPKSPLDEWAQQRAVHKLSKMIKGQGSQQVRDLFKQSDKFLNVLRTSGCTAVVAVLQQEDISIRATAILFKQSDKDDSGSLDM